MIKASPKKNKTISLPACAAIPASRLSVPAHVDLALVALKIAIALAHRAPVGVRNAHAVVAAVLHVAFVVYK